MTTSSSVALPALAEPVHADFNLAGASADPRQAVRHGEAEVVMAVGRDHAVACDLSVHLREVAKSQGMP